MKDWIKNHQKLAGTIGLGVIAAVWTGLYFLTYDEQRGY